MMELILDFDSDSSLNLDFDSEQVVVGDCYLWEQTEIELVKVWMEDVMALLLIDIEPMCLDLVLSLKRIETDLQGNI